ncbi:MAG: hypothetical protein LBB87_00605 [Nitrososphaerota archaeon]|jgi:hypothetical protein|nr:hypothetical protein [Nitrososphaerota archaeon]
MNKTKVVEAIFSPAVFAILLLSCFILAIINMFFHVIPYPWGMVLLPPLVLFGLLGYFIEEKKS